MPIGPGEFIPMLKKPAFIAFPIPLIFPDELLIPQFMICLMPASLMGNIPFMFIELLRPSNESRLGELLPPIPIPDYETIPIRMIVTRFEQKSLTLIGERHLTELIVGIER